MRGVSEMERVGSESRIGIVRGPVPVLDDADIDRFWSIVDKSGGPDACWMWMGGRGSHGYGVFCANNRRYRAHRVAWELANGPIPNDPDGPKIVVCHHCDTPLCCNPYRCLFLGTQTDNMRDAARKGRMATGERHGTRTHPESVKNRARREARKGRVRCER